MKILDSGHALVAALGHDVGRAELAGELLPRVVAAHGDDPPGAHLPGGEHAEEADRAVADDRDRLAWLHVGRVGGEPAGAQNVRRRQKARDEIIRRHALRGHKRPVRQRHAQHRRLHRVMNSRFMHDD